MRFLVDASTLIALVDCDRLGVLRSLTKEAWTTSDVAGVGAEAVRQAIDEGWIHVIDGGGNIPRLGPGESSVILAARPDDIVVLDDRTARLEAQTRDLRVTGLIGLLVHGHRRGAVDTPDAIGLLDALAQGDFRMSVALYRWALEHIEG